MLKTKAKILIGILFFIAVLCLFNTNTVNATTEEEAEKMLEFLPDEMYLDIPEIDYEKSTSLVKEEILEIWENNNVSTDGIEFNIWGYQPYSMDYFYEGVINIKIEKTTSMGTSETYINKTIKITYNNTKNKNASDEQYVKNLVIESPRYYETDISFYKDETEDYWDRFFEISEQYYTKLINNKDIIINATAGAGGGNGLTMGTGEGGTYILIFKNSVLYDIRCMSQETLVPVITIPNTVKEADVNDYVEKIIKENYSNVKEITSITKGATITGGSVSTGKWEKEVKDGYTVKGSIGQIEFEDVIIVRKEQNSSLQIKDENTNIRIDADTTVLPENTQLIVKEIKEGQIYETVKNILNDLVDKMYVYDITLENEGVEVQPNGNVKVSIPIPEEMDPSKLIVYRIDDEENKTEYEVTIETLDNIRYATFETDHFSTYVLTEKKTEQNTTNENVSDIKGEKDDTPKTGTSTNMIFIIILAMLTGGITIKILKHKKG